MIDIKFKINGRNVRPNQLGNELKRAVLADIKKEVARKVRHIRCPKHGQTARVTPQRPGGDQLKWSIEGCCEELIERVKRALA